MPVEIRDKLVSTAREIYASQSQSYNNSIQKTFGKNMELLGTDLESE